MLRHQILVLFALVMFSFGCGKDQPSQKNPGGSATETPKRVDPEPIEGDLPATVPGFLYGTILADGFNSDLYQDIFLDQNLGRHVWFFPRSIVPVTELKSAFYQPGKKFTYAYRGVAWQIDEQIEWIAVRMNLPRSYVHLIEDHEVTGVECPGLDPREMKILFPPRVGLLNEVMPITFSAQGESADRLHEVMEKDVYACHLIVQLKSGQKVRKIQVPISFSKTE